ncbi:helix-turn-helix transcriptional regulator [Miniphocaeibacter halophilus]|uniref:WYL domain-containing protein n=1 Tax=Miniphocaeibacter halophilus TaxID=2931922 RepID=A0AC61MTE9_9FIRM|nr:WYL domain-containing protein [Miniphocaeibacter halophilus]QQK08653.1 WYL domain-containing protein [Miniphocaeibacter halophilus]
MKKSRRLIELQRYINTKKEFTAQEIADEFNISVRTAHRDMLELSDLGVYYDTKQGNNGGYKLLSTKLLPPVNLTENEAFAVFFASHSLTFYSSLPFEIDLKSVLRKLYFNLPEDSQKTVDSLKTKLFLKNKKRNISNNHLKDLLKYSGTKNVFEMYYDTLSGVKKYKVVFICLYSENGFWYVPSLDLKENKIKHYRVDRVENITSTNQEYENIDGLVEKSFDFNSFDEPTRLYVKLNKIGIRACQDNPYTNENIKIENNGETGFIDELIDKKDIEFFSDFFIKLSRNAVVIEPMEMKKYIYEKAKEIQDLYGEY